MSRDGESQRGMRVGGGAGWSVAEVEVRRMAMVVAAGVRCRDGAGCEELPARLVIAVLAERATDASTATVSALTPQR